MGILSVYNREYIYTLFLSATTPLFNLSLAVHSLSYPTFMLKFFDYLCGFVN